MKAESQVVTVDTQLSKYSSCILDTICKVKAKYPVDKTSRIQTLQIAINLVMKINNYTVLENRKAMTCF